jgi:hypothetical protein
MTKLSSLVELPEKKKVYENLSILGMTVADKRYGAGWNDAITEITKLLDREFDKGKIEALTLCVGQESWEAKDARGTTYKKIAKAVLLNLKSCLKGER